MIGEAALGLINGIIYNIGKSTMTTVHLSVDPTPTPLNPVFVRVGARLL